MTLAVGVRAHEHGRMALAVEADLAALVVAARGLLDSVGDPEPQEPAHAAAAARRDFEPLGVDHRQRIVHVPLELAAIVVVRERCLNGIAEDGMMLRRRNSTLSIPISPAAFSMTCSTSESPRDARRHAPHPSGQYS